MKVIKYRLKATGGVMQTQDVVYPKAIDAGRINADELAKLMVSNCSVSYSQVLAVLSALAEVVGDMVTLGHSVEIDGIGVLEPKVKGRVVYGENNKPKIMDGKATVSFKAAKKLGKKFLDVSFKLASDKVRNNVTLSDDEATHKAFALAKKRCMFSVQNFACVTGTSHSYASRILKATVARGQLECVRIGHMDIYMQQKK